MLSLRSSPHLRDPIKAVVSWGLHQLVEAPVAAAFKDPPAQKDSKTSAPNERERRHKVLRWTSIRIRVVRINDEWEECGLASNIEELAGLKVVI